MAVRKTAKRGVGRKKVTAAAPAKAQAAQPKYKKYMGWIIGGVVLYVVFLILFNLIFFKENVPSTVRASLVAKITAMDSGVGSFQPAGIALWGKDRIAVSDSQTKRILVFNRDGKFVKFLGDELSNEERDKVRKKLKELPEDAFLGLTGICVSGDDLYALDDERNSVVVFGPTMKRTQSLDFRSLGCYGPRGLNVLGDHFMVSDTGTHRVLKANRDGQVAVTFGGQHGDGKGQMNNPVDTVADGKGHVAVADLDNSRVQIFDAKGKFQKAIKVGARPTGLDYLPNGDLVVVSSEGNFVKIVKPNGSLVGTLKDDKGEVSFTSFTNVRVGADGLLYLAGPDNISIVKLESK